MMRQGLPEGLTRMNDTRPMTADSANGGDEPRHLGTIRLARLTSGIEPIPIIGG